MWWILQTHVVAVEYLLSFYNLNSTNKNTLQSITQLKIDIPCHFIEQKGLNQECDQLHEIRRKIAFFSLFEVRCSLWLSKRNQQKEKQISWTLSEGEIYTKRSKRWTIPSRRIQIMKYQIILKRGSFGSNAYCKVCKFYTPFTCKIMKYQIILKRGSFGSNAYCKVCKFYTPFTCNCIFSAVQYTALLTPLAGHL